MDTTSKNQRADKSALSFSPLSVVTYLTRFTGEKSDLKSQVKCSEMQFGLTDESAQLMRQLSMACGQNLPTDILKDDWPGLQIHHQHGFQLSLCSFQFNLQAAQ